jgi:colicin import membrane protein
MFDWRPDGYLLPGLLALAVHGLLVLVLAAGALLTPNSQPTLRFQPIQARMVSLEDIKQPQPARVEPAVKSPPNISDVERQRQARQQIEAERQAKAKAARQAAARQKALAEAKARQEAAKQKARAEAKAKAAQQAKQKAAEQAKQRQQQAAKEKALAEARAKQRAAEQARKQALAAEKVAQQAAADQRLVQSYGRAIMAKVTQNWSRPPSAHNNMKAVLLITLVPDGTVVNVQLVTSSGNGDFDRSAINAVWKSGHFQVPADARVFNDYFRQLRFIFDPDDLS